jgi:peptidoglycan hydrolase CwlO-like protein
MSIELIAISGFIVAILGGLSQCISKSNLKHCNCGCINSDCVDENKSLDKQMQELNEKIERNEKKINKNKGKLDVLKKKRCSNIPKTPESIDSITSFESIETEL